MRSKAATVEDYIRELPEDRRDTVIRMRELILANLPVGYEESMTWGMPTYEVPLSAYPKTYNKKPLMFLALAAQKNYYSLYLMHVYQDGEAHKRLEEAFERMGEKMNIGKSCLRFKSIDRIPLDEIAALIASMPLQDYISLYETQYNSRRK